MDVENTGVEDAGAGVSQPTVIETGGRTGGAELGPRARWRFTLRFMWLVLKLLTRIVRADPLTVQFMEEIEQALR